MISIAKNLRKILLFLIFIISFSSISVNAATKDDALAAVVNFLKAQKNCNTDMMVTHSQYFHKIENVKEFYTWFCTETPLEEAKITNLSIVNDETALVSIQSTYKEMVTLRTTPVVKIDGHWKIVMGIPPSGAKSTKKQNRSAKEAEVEQLFTEYTNAIKAHDIPKMKTFIKILPKSSNEKIEKHLKALSQQPTPEITTYGINMISDSLAITQVEIEYPNHSYTQNLAVFNEKGQWKLIFGHPLTNSFIPKSDHSVNIK
ncbi:hypothetical protein [Neobacillus niacini]|uniref:hypothetical protein n=1 Tax=Neobacillus niacini TaxID=86668 RepID=UPI00285BDAD7|nr:hypothetical protein [Neobacillus niacini]MDR7000161.1 hypothetical protein [Neobacillus niacini]